MYVIVSVRAFTGRMVLAFDLAYHGGIIGFGQEPSLLNLPHDFVFGTIGDAEKTRSVLTEDIDVIIVEPLQSSGSMRPATKELIAFLRQAAHMLGAVLVFDEVVTSRRGVWIVRGVLLALNSAHIKEHANTILEVFTELLEAYCEGLASNL